MRASFTGRRNVIGVTSAPKRYACGSRAIAANDSHASSDRSWRFPVK